MAVPSFFSPAAACGSSTFLPPLLIRTQFPSCHRYFSCQTQLPYFFVHVHQQRLQRHCGESHCLAKIRRSRDANALEPGLPFLFPAFYAVVLDLLGNVNALACGDIVEKFDMRLDAILDIAQVSVGFTALSPGVMFAIVTVEAVALIGAFVGGILARQRKEELQRLNSQLRKINEYLRNKAITETYAPLGGPLDERIPDDGREELTRVLKAGKKYLREKKSELAHKEFTRARQQAQQIGDATEEKKAARGLGASCQRQGKYQDAITYHSLVLEISERTGETSGNTEALGSIADCYCELGDFDMAQIFYNRYIDRLTMDDS
eukprot:c17761_g1_i2 orf=166-1125(+)